MELTSRFISTLQEGDLLEFKRGMYQHWAVYIGDGQVVHLAGEGGDGLNVEAKHMFTLSGTTFDKAEVRLDHISKVVHDSIFSVNNSKDKKWTPLPAREIVKRALSKHGSLVNYNLLFSNCEHFAKWCRYDKEKCDQVESWLTGLAVGVAVLVTGFLAALLGSRSNESSNEKERKT